MKEVYILIILILAVNILCEDPARLVINRFMDKSPKELFKVFHIVFKKDYSLNSEVALTRYRIFKNNLKIIKETNAKNLSYKFGVNQFTDLTPEEFQSNFLTNFEILKGQIQRQGLLIYKPNTNKINDVPQVRTKIDWKGLFNPARQQGGCGSCWAFASTSALEANWWKLNQSQKKITLAPQQLVDCNKENYGCGGGWYKPAFDYILKEGIVEEGNYEYLGENGICNIPPTARRVKLDNFQGNDDCNLEEWYGMLQQGPIAVLMDASQFHLYESGIMVFEKCNHVTHAIVATGWDSDAQGEFLTIRNSWGETWGEEGYMRVRVDHSNNRSCFATQYSYLPIVSKAPLPPVPIECFNLSNSWVAKKTWRLNRIFSGIVSFRAIGTGFSFAGFWNDAEDSRGHGYDITFSNNSIVIVNGRKETCCSWKLAISPSVENKYKISFSVTNKSISVNVNGTNLTCQEDQWSPFVTSIGFISPSSSVRLCDVQIATND